MNPDGTSQVCIVITISADGASYNVSSRRAYAGQMPPQEIAAWDRITDGLMTQIVHNPGTFEETGAIAISSRLVSEMTDRCRDDAYNREAGFSAENIVVFPQRTPNHD